MPSFTIVAKRFSPDEFANYLAGFALTAWKPFMVVLHNTAVPTLKDRPNGFSAANMADLRHYYGEVQKWSGGPHLFVDPNGIWVFNPLDDPGVHSPSWNSTAWGVEMLGDYERESFETGPGLAVKTITVNALAMMFRRLGLKPDDAHFKLHREDPKTTHKGCPGKGVSKEAVRREVLSLMDRLVAPQGQPVKVVVYRKGRGSVPTVLDAKLVEGVTMVDECVAVAQMGLPVTGLTGTARIVALRPLVVDRYEVTPRLDQGKVYLVER